MGPNSTLSPVGFAPAALGRRTMVTQEHQKGKVVSFLEALPLEEYLWSFLHIDLFLCCGPLSVSIPRVLFMMSQLNHGFPSPATRAPFNVVSVNSGSNYEWVHSQRRCKSFFFSFFPYLCFLTGACAQEVLCVCCWKCKWNERAGGSTIMQPVNVRINLRQMRAFVEMNA